MKDENNILNDEEELNKLASLLSDAGKKSPFSTPEGYFDALPQIIMRKCQPEVSGKKWAWGISSNYSTVMVAATVIVGFILVLFFLFVRPSRLVHKNQTDTTAFVPDERMMNDLSNELDESTIIDAVISGSPEFNSDSGILEKDDLLPVNSDYTKDDLINYLLDANTDIDLISQ